MHTFIGKLTDGDPRQRAQVWGSDDVCLARGALKPRLLALLLRANEVGLRLSICGAQRGSGAVMIVSEKQWGEQFYCLLLPCASRRLMQAHDRKFLTTHDIKRRPKNLQSCFFIKPTSTRTPTSRPHLCQRAEGWRGSGSLHRARHRSPPGCGSFPRALARLPAASRVATIGIASG